MKDIVSHKLRTMRSQLLDDIRSGRGSQSLRRDAALEQPSQPRPSEALNTPRTESRQRAATAAAAVLSPTGPGSSSSSRPGDEQPAPSPYGDHVPKRRFSGAL